MSIQKKLKIKKKIRYAEYYDMTATFDALYADSQRGKVFTELMDIITSEENIKLAYRSIKGNSGSNTAGTDGKTIKDVKAVSEQAFVETIRKRLRYYKPQSVKRVEIPKPDGRTRPLGIPTIWDRLVQQCILQVLEPICEAKFHERSNGFRPNRSAHHAIAQCYRMIQKQGLHFVVDIDISGFFDNVNHHKLKSQMWNMGIRDKKLICIISEMLKAPILMPNGKKIFPTKGTPQGGILSPLLSNIVLNELDWWIASQWEFMPTHYPYQLCKNINGSESRGPIFSALRKSQLKEMYIVRYADDFKIFCRTRQDAVKVFHAVKQMLKLSPNHREHLKNVRGLTDKQIDELGYKSTPSFFLCRKLTERLIEKGCMVQGVPGFYMKDGRWTIKFCTKMSGILIPVRGIDGLIYGMQIRLDVPIKDENDDPEKSGTKYIWLSSSNKPMGVSSGTPIHFIGDPYARNVYISFTTQTRLLVSAGSCIRQGSFFFTFANGCCLSK